MDMFAESTILLRICNDETSTDTTDIANTFDKSVQTSFKSWYWSMIRARLR